MLVVLRDNQFEPEAAQLEWTLLKVDNTCGGVSAVGRNALRRMSTLVVITAIKITAKLSHLITQFMRC